MQHDRPFNHIFENGVIAPRWHFLADGTATLSYASGVLTLAGAQLALPDGTAAAPALKVGDEQNGLYSPSANQLGIALNGALQYTLAGGNIGAGVGLSAWGSTYRVVEIGKTGNALYSATADEAIGIVSNAYYDGSNWKYVASDDASAWLQNEGYLQGYGAASGTAGNNITFVQVFSLRKGETLALEGATSQAGTGITFPATQNASSNAKTLDDYEKGTVTNLSLTGDGGSGVTYSVRECVYVKIGSQVCISGTIQLTSKGTMTGNVYLAGLPFTTTTEGTDVRAGGFVEYGSVGNLFLFTPSENVTTCYFISGGTTLFGWASMTNTSTMWFSLQYRTDQ